MEATFISAGSSKTLTLTSYTPVFLPAASLRSIRREFLGCCHNLRPPGRCNLRSRERIRKSGRFPVRSSPFVVRASLDSGLILVVVAVSTFSAIAVAYFHLNYRKRKNSSEVSASPPTFRGGKDVAENPLGIGVQDGGDIHNGKSVEVNGSFEEWKEENTNNLEEKEADQIQERAVMQDYSVLTKPSEPPIDSSPFVVASVSIADQIQEPAVMLDDSVLTIPSDPPHDDSHLSFASVSIPANEQNAMDELSASPLLHGPVALESVIVRAKSPEKQAENCEQKKEMHFDIPHAIVGIHSFASPRVVDDTCAIELEYNNLNQKPFEYNIFMESSREGLHTFYGSNHSAAKFPSFRSPKATSPSAVSTSTASFSLHHKAPEIMGMNLSRQRSLQSTDEVEEKELSAHGRGSLLHKREEIRNDKRFPIEKDGRHAFPQDGKSMAQLLLQNVVLDKCSGHSSETLDGYNRLLRDGRLTHCISLLEDMERQDLLDMDKIHHASFFKTCKKQKAVKEAFRFVKLVPNPTLSTFNMLMSVCASSHDPEGAREVLQLVRESGMIADCKLYTTLISTCAKSGKVDAMFEVFHQMENSGVEPNVHTFGALIDGCARSGQVAKAFGVYGILRSKNVKPDRVVFNALISACGQSGVVDRAFDVLAEMTAEAQPIDPDHITIGALMMACFNAGQVERAKEVYKMIHDYGIKGTPEVYTIAVNSCSKSGDWEFACRIYDDMKENSVTPDEVFFSALIDVGGHAGRLDDAFGVLQEAKSQGIRLGHISYSSLMGACCNAKNWQKALELYEKIKSIKIRPTISTMNALITALCDGDQLPKAMEILDEIKALGLSPNSITYSMLVMASERKDNLEVSLMLLSRAKEDAVSPNLIMCKCMTSMFLQRFEKACSAGEPVLSFKTGRPQIENKWTSMALMVYRETILGGTIPTTEELSQVLGCLRFPHDASLRDRLIENLEVGASSQRRHNLFSLVDGFGEYDLRAVSLIEEATSLGILPFVSFKKVPIVFDSTKLQSYVAEVYLLTIFRGFKHRFAAGAKLPNINVLLPVEEKQITTPEGEKTINLAGRVGQAVASLLRRLGIPYQRKESSGKIRINGPALGKWFQCKPASSFNGKPGDLRSSQARLGKQIMHQQRSIRTGNLSLE